MNILVTGAAGYIGSLLCDYLLREGHKVTAVDSFMYNDQSLNLYYNHKNFNVVKCDVRDFNKIRELLKNQDIIIPLAALVGAPLCDFEKESA